MRKQSRCVAQKDRYSLAFLGIAEGDRRLTGTERARLNDAMRDALRDLSVLLTPSNAEAAGDLLALSTTLGMSREEFDQRLTQLNAEFTLVVRVLRPGPQTALLNISVYARPGNGGQGCDDVITVPVDLATFAEGDEPVLGNDFFTFSGAVEEALMRNIELLQRADRLGWTLESRFPVGCALPDWARDAFEDAYFDVRAHAAAAQVGSAVDGFWPGLTDAPGHDAPVLSVVLQPSVAGKPGVGMRISLEQGGVRRDSQRLAAVVPQAALVGCYGPPSRPDPVAVAAPASPSDGNNAPAVAAPPLAIAMTADRATVQAGDEVAITIETSQDCRLTLLNIDASGQSCLLLPHPVLGDVVLRAGERYRFPPRGRLRATQPGIETFVGMCNASPEALQVERSDTARIDCSEPAETPRSFERAVLDFAGAPEDTASSPDAKAAFSRGEVAIEVRAADRP